MSNQFYELNWRDAIKQIEETYNYEFEPLKENLKKTIKYKRKDKEWFKHYSELYIKYLHVFRILENCQENSNNPQKKQILRKMLDNVLQRLLTVKRDLVRFNTHPKDINSDYVNLHGVIEENNLTLDFLKIPIPRYFKTEKTKQNESRDDNLKEIFEAKEEKNSHENSKNLKLFKRDNPLNISIRDAIEIIKKMERGRQGIEIGQIEKKKLLDIYKNNFGENTITEFAVEEVITIIQKFIRGFFARKTCHFKRKEEMKFLNLEFDTEGLKNLNDKIDLIHLERKQKLKEMENEIQESYYSIKKNLLENEGLDIKEKMIDDRRKFIIQQFELKKGKELISDISDFYNPKEQIEDNKKDKKGKPSKPPAKPAKNKKMTEDELFLKERVAMGPESSPELKNLIELIQKYFEDWGKQINLNDNMINRDMIIKEIFPEIQKEIQEHVDKIVNIELEDLRYKLDISKKKPPKTKKITKPKKVKIPGENLVQDKDPVKMAKELVKFGILKKSQNQFLNTFYTSENILRHLDEEQMGKVDPSLKQLKNLIKEQIVLTLGTGFNPEKMNRTFLFYGAEGSGKSHMVNSIINETNAIFLDMSPVNLCKVFLNKNSITEILYKIFSIAKTFQPAIIFFDESEHFFAKKNLKKLKNFAGKCSKFKKDLIKQVNKHLTLEDKVIIIGNTRNPKYLNVSDAKKFFYKKFYFPFPDYSARRFIFQKLMNNKINEFRRIRNLGLEPFTKDIDINETFPFSMFAFHTEGYSIGSFIKLIEIVLTNERIERFEIMPLKVEELIDPLSSLDFCSQEEYKEFQEFGFAVNGMQERLDKQIELKNEDSKNKKKK